MPALTQTAAAPASASPTRKRSRVGIIAANLAHNFLFKLRVLAGNIVTEKGASHEGFSLEQSLAYIDEVFADYLAYGHIREANLAGKRVLEIGPGDNVGVALRFLAAGCSQVVCADKFSARRDPEQQLRIYRAMRARLSGAERRRFDEAAGVEGAFTPNAERLQYLCGVSVEQATHLFAAESFDLIVSRAVLMEMADADAAFRAMDRLLKPGGLMIHKVAPFNDYRMFTGWGHGRLEFLTVPGWLYRRMVSDVGGPNRKPVTYYRRKMTELSYDAQIHVVSAVGSRLKYPPGTYAAPRGTSEYAAAKAELDRVRCRLAREFRGIADEDMLVEDTFLVAAKPARGAVGAI